METILKYETALIRGALVNAFILLMNALYYNVNLIGESSMYPVNHAPELLKANEPIFDFIVVGSGAAGCATALKIALIQDWTVLLIEAGDYPPPSSEVPGFYSELQSSDIDWNYKLDQETHACQAMINKECRFSRGRVFGGTSTISNMHYIRALPDDFEKANIPFWSTNITETIFKTMENYQAESKVEHQYTYGTNGKIMLTHFNHSNQLKTMMQKIYRMGGYYPIPKRKFIGFIDHLVYARNGERYNMGKNFINPYKDRPNLFVAYNSNVDRVIMGEHYDKRAIGVNFTYMNTKVFVRARKEVILAGGAINNVKLLLLSGVGPLDYLHQRKIKMQSNIPYIGRNLQMHVAVPMFFKIDICGGHNKTRCFYNDVYSEKEFLSDTFNYILKRNGNFMHTNINEFALYINTKKIGVTVPTIGVYHEFFRIGDRRLEHVISSLNYVPAILRSLQKLNKEFMILMAMVTVLNPLSRGEVMLNDTHYESNPTIKANFFTDYENIDFNTMLSGFQFMTNLSEHNYMKKHNFKLLPVDVPNCRNYKFCSRHYVNCYIKNMAYPLQDATGTTKMGPRCQLEAVVSVEMEVRGVRCLRVADSSVLRTIVSGSTVATDAVLGFRLGEMLREKWVKDYVSPFNFNDTESTSLEAPDILDIS